MWTSILTQAIRDHAVVEFRYNDEHRVVEPYRLGVSDGRLLLSGWQSRKGWRTFGVDGIEALEVTTRHFDLPREGFSADPRMDRVVASV